MNVELTKEELNSLCEALGELRKRIASDHQSGQFQFTEAISDPLFIAASHLHYKFAKTLDPTSSVKIDDYLNYGTNGLIN